MCILALVDTHAPSLVTPPPLATNPSLVLVQSSSVVPVAGWNSKRPVELVYPTLPPVEVWV